MTDTPTTADSATTPDMVRWAFRTILGHHDVADAVVQAHLRSFPSFEDLCEGLKNSEEFAITYGPRSVSRAGRTVDADEATLRRVIATLHRAFLRREVDPGEMTEGLALLDRAGGLAGVGELAALLAALRDFAAPVAGAAVPGQHRPQTALPAAPPAPWHFVGRQQEMEQLLRWFMGGQRRLFLSGAAGAGKTELAAEFGRRLAAAGAAGSLPGGLRLDHVIHLGPGTQPGEPPSARILRIAGLMDDTATLDESGVDDGLRRFLSHSNGLIILDDMETAAAAERLFVQVLAARGHHKVLYTHPAAHPSPLDPTLLVAGWRDDAEYAAFFALCANRYGVPSPGVGEYEMIARATGGLPGRLEAVFAARTQATGYAAAVAAAA